MTLQHTKGPWSVIGRYRVEADSYGLIASIRGASDDPATDANAKLIAAAPDMAEALKALVDDGPNYHQRHWEEARAALSKAGVK
jgi:hypothetical protein